MAKSGFTWEGFFNKFAGRLMNIILLGFFSLVLCLPVVTAGASFAALNVAMRSYLLEEDPKPLKTSIFSSAGVSKTGLTIGLMILTFCFLMEVTSICLPPS